MPRRHSTSVVQPAQCTVMLNSGRRFVRSDSEPLPTTRPRANTLPTQSRRRGLLSRAVSVKPLRVLVMGQPTVGKTGEMREGRGGGEGGGRAVGWWEGGRSQRGSHAGGGGGGGCGVRTQPPQASPAFQKPLRSRTLYNKIRNNFFNLY